MKPRTTKLNGVSRNRFYEGPLTRHQSMLSGYANTPESSPQPIVEHANDSMSYA